MIKKVLHNFVKKLHYSHIQYLILQYDCLIHLSRSMHTIKNYICLDNKHFLI